MIPYIRHGSPVPYKIWMRITDILADYVRAGEEWVAAGKPINGDMYINFCANEHAYQQMADAIWFARLTGEQREEWSAISKERKL